MNRLLRSVPEDRREAVARQAREELGTVLATAPIKGDPLADVGARVKIAAAFGVAYRGG